MEMIVMTADQAMALSGSTSSGHALRPILLADGETYVLPLAVMTDWAHRHRWEELRTLPTRNVDLSEFQTSG